MVKYVKGDTVFIEFAALEPAGATGRVTAIEGTSITVEIVDIKGWECLTLGAPLTFVRRRARPGAWLINADEYAELCAQIDSLESLVNLRTAAGYFESIVASHPAPTGEILDKWAVLQNAYQQWSNANV